MCGIVGMLVRDGLAADDVAEVAALTELMQRRGPDDSGTWDDARACSLGFRRLAIIDLTEGGHQPMLTDDGEHVLVFNGEVYNYRELRSELAAEGCRFRSTSDTEVVLQALASWGTAALERFNGMFALGWYRPASQTLVLARDPVGIKPLCWWWSPEAFVFGSQYDQVVRHRRCRRDRIDPSTLHLYLRLGYLPQHYGLVRDTGQVPPGHFVEVKPGEPPIPRRFRSITRATPAAERLRGAAADDAVDEAVSRAVRRQQVSDVRMGAFLSGGVDSPLVAANMASPDSARIPAFTIGTEDAATDESAPAAQYAEMLGLEHHLRRISGSDALALVDDVAAANTEPFGDFSSFPTLLVSQLAAEHVKTVQSGDGGDELFWGYPRFQRLVGARPWFRFPEILRRGAYGATKVLPTRRRPPRGVIFPTVGDWYLDAHSGLRAVDFEWIAPEVPTLPMDLDLFDRRRPGSADELLQWMRGNELACHLPMVLQKVDRAAMHHSLEVRVPLLDLDVVDLAMQVDPSAAIDGGTGKVVLRHALRRHVPVEHIPIPKRGFTVPMQQWLAEDLQGPVRELLLERDPFPTGFFDRAGLARYYDAHRTGRFDLTRGLWNLLALQLWADRHLRPLAAT